MGSLGAQDMAEQVGEGNVTLEHALSWHLTANHYPALPVEYVDVAKRVITWVNEHEHLDGVEWDTLIDLPVGINPRPRDTTYTDVDGVETPQASAGHLVEILHLDAFLTGGE